MSKKQKILIAITLVICCTLAVLALISVVGKRGENAPTDPSFSESTGENVPQSENVPVDAEPETTDDATYIGKREAVFATANVNVRAGAGTEFEIVGQLKKGEEIERISTGDNGWSKVEYKGSVRYVSDKYLKTAKELEEETKESEAPSEEATTEGQKTVYLYATEEVNVRQEVSGSSKKLGELKAGDKVEKLSDSENGWTKVKYKNEECYVFSSYLIDEKPEIPERNTVDPRGDNWNLTVVNFYNEYDSTYEPKLKKTCEKYGYNIYMDERVADWYTKMYEAALEDGIKLTPISGYRSYATQEKNYKNRIKLWQSKGYSYNEAVKKTAEVILPPGTSEHNLGLAMDICRLDYNFDESEEYKWLSQHAADYGFILRYTEENKAKTGVVAEPWHWRFVGVEDAKKIKQSGMCLEDYTATV